MNMFTILKSLTVVIALLFVLSGCGESKDKITEIDFSNLHKVPNTIAFEFSDGVKILIGSYRVGGGGRYKNSYIFTSSHLCKGDISTSKEDNDTIQIKISAREQSCEKSIVNPLENSNNDTYNFVDITMTQYALGDIRISNQNKEVVRIYEPMPLWDFSINMNNFEDFEAYAYTIPRTFKSRDEGEIRKLNFFQNTAISFVAEPDDDMHYCDSDFTKAYTGISTRICKLTSLAQNSYVYKDKVSELYVFIDNGKYYHEVLDEWSVVTDNHVISR